MITHIFDFRFIYLPHFSCGLWLSFLVLSSETARRRSRLLLRLIKMWTRGNRFSLSFGWIVSLTGFKKTFFLNCCLFCSKRNGKIPLVFIMSVKRFKDISDRKTFYRATLLKPPSGEKPWVATIYAGYHRRVGFVGRKFEDVRRGVKPPFSWPTAGDLDTWIRRSIWSPKTFKSITFLEILV